MYFLDFFLSTFDRVHLDNTPAGQKVQCRGAFGETQACLHPFVCLYGPNYLLCDSFFYLLNHVRCRSADKLPHVHHMQRVSRDVNFSEFLNASPLDIHDREDHKDTLAVDLEWLARQDAKQA